MADIDTHVAVDLHPDTFLSLPGVDDNTAPFIAPAVEAFDAAYKYIGSIYEVREAAFADPTLTQEGALLKADDFAKQRRRLATCTSLRKPTDAKPSGPVGGGAPSLPEPTSALCRWRCRALSLPPGESLAAMMLL